MSQAVEWTGVPGLIFHNIIIGLDDGISVSEILAGVGAGTVVEDYPNYPKGRSVLVLQLDGAVELFTSSGGSRKA